MKVKSKGKDCQPAWIINEKMITAPGDICQCLHRYSYQNKSVRALLSSVIVRIPFSCLCWTSALVKARRCTKWMQDMLVAAAETILMWNWPWQSNWSDWYNVTTPRLTREGLMIHQCSFPWCCSTCTAKCTHRWTYGSVTESSKAVASAVVNCWVNNYL